MNDTKSFSENMFEIAVVNTENLTFVKNGATPDGAFTVSVFLKKTMGSEQYGLMFFNPIDPKVLVFKNVIYSTDEDDYKNEIELYKQHVSQITGVDYSANGMGFKGKMETKIDVQGYTTKRAVDEHGNPLFNEDGTPKMVNAPFSGSGEIN